MRIVLTLIPQTLPNCNLYRLKTFFKSLLLAFLLSLELFMLPGPLTRFEIKTNFVYNKLLVYFRFITPLGVHALLYNSLSLSRRWLDLH